jgi:hypothetical protein
MQHRVSFTAPLAVHILKAASSGQERGGRAVDLAWPALTDIAHPEPGCNNVRGDATNGGMSAS